MANSRCSRTLGKDLPGAIVVASLEPDDVPDSALSALGQVKAVKFDRTAQADKFSLAGVSIWILIGIISRIRQYRFRLTRGLQTRYIPFLSCGRHSAFTVIQHRCAAIPFRWMP